MFESSPVGQICSLSVNSGDMEIPLASLLNRAVKTEPEKPKIDFIESLEALPPLTIDDVLEEKSKVEKVEEAESSEVFEEEEEGMLESGGLSGEFDDLIDRIAAGGVVPPPKR